MIWNEICDELIRNTRLVLNEQSADTIEILTKSSEQLPDPLEIHDLRHILRQAKEQARGGAARGIECLELTTKGYSSKEISELIGADPGTVRMWMTRARKYLRGIPELRRFAEAV